MVTSPSDAIVAEVAGLAGASRGPRSAGDPLVLAPDGRIWREDWSERALPGPAAAQRSRKGHRRGHELRVELCAGMTTELIDGRLMAYARR